MNIDLHNHTKRCNHAFGECSEYIQAAIKEGIDIFGFACHAPMDFDKEYRMNLNEVDSYIDEIRTLALQYEDKIDIKVGFEVDYIYNKEYLIEQKVLQSKVDYLIGSVHFLNNWGFDNEAFLEKYKEIDIYIAWREYLQSLRAMAQSGLFDIVGHFDLFKIFNHKPDVGLKKDILETLEVIKTSNMVLEINTAGLRKKVNEIYPSIEILEWANRLQIPITFSSDAHSPNQVGYKKDFAISLAKEIGFKEVISFNLRQKEVFPL